MVNPLFSQLNYVDDNLLTYLFRKVKSLTLITFREMFYNFNLPMPNSIQIKHPSSISDIGAWQVLTLDDFTRYNQKGKRANRGSIDSVYSVIRKQSGQLTTRHIEKELGLDIESVRYAIKHLTKEGKIQRVKGLGTNKIEFYYRVC
jgi:hypothetical protein